MPVTTIVTGPDLGSEFLIGTEVANKITIAVDGTTITKPGGVLQSEQPTLTYDNPSTTLTYTAPGQAAVNIDLGGLTTDIFVNGGSFDPATSVLTLVDNDGVSPDITIDLSALLGVSTDAGNALTNGADGKPFLPATALTVADEPGQLLLNSLGGGAFLNCDRIRTSCTSQATSLFGTPLFNAFSA